MRKFVANALLSHKATGKHAVRIAAVFSALCLFFYCMGYFFLDTEIQYSNALGFARQLCEYIAAVAAPVAGQCAAVLIIRALAKLSVPESVSVFTVSCAFALLVSLFNYCLNASSAAALLMEYFLPSLAVFVLLSRLCLNGGIAPVLVYAALTDVHLLFPIAVQSTGFTHICLTIVMPIMFIIALNCLEEDEDKRPKSTKKGEEKPKSKIKQAVFGFAIATGIALSIVFSSGVLPLKPTTIATGSMTPELNVGDIVIVSSLDKDSIDVGDIIKFRKNGVNVVHRVSAVSSDDSGNVTYITKGDANNAADPGCVSQSDIEGKVVGTVPFIGKITLWINGID